MKDKINSNSISLAGEFAVLSQLSLRGFDANMTLGHTKGVDILISDPTNGKMYKLEVKTNMRNLRRQPASSKLFGKIASEWMMDVKHESIIDPDLFYCFVNIEKETKLFHFYIVPSKVVAKYVKEEHDLWLQTKEHHKIINMRQFRIGVKECSYKISTPTEEDYKDNWRFER
jgi:hypothetical protein